MPAVKVVLKELVLLHLVIWWGCGLILVKGIKNLGIITGLTPKVIPFLALIWLSVPILWVQFHSYPLSRIGVEPYPYLRNLLAVLIPGTLILLISSKYLIKTVYSSTLSVGDFFTQLIIIIYISAQQIASFGLLMPTLSEEWGFWPALLVTVLSFTSLHLFYNNGLRVAPLALIFGLMIGMCLRYTGNLGLSTAIHMLPYLLFLFMGIKPY